MNTAHPPTLEIESLADWDAHIGGVEHIGGWVMQSVDLVARAADLARVRVDGALFLGCELADESRDDLLERGALIFPRLPNLPFNPYRAVLYSPTELYDAVLAGRFYPQTRDAQIYGWARSIPEPTPLAESLAMTLHDHAITDALAEQLTESYPDIIQNHISSVC